MQRIVPHLWYDRAAHEAARRYTSAFEGSRVTRTSALDGTPSGTVEVVDAIIAGLEVVLLGAGPEFRFTPAISFLVSCRTPAEADHLWGALAPGGTPLMELATYPFSERYGWIQDQYGLSWQIMTVGDRPVSQRITPVFLFTGDVAGRAEEAMEHWIAVFPDSARGATDRYGPNEAPDREGTVRHGGFSLAGVAFAAMDSAHPHGFGFNEAISFLVRCRTQDEIDYYWRALSAVPEAEQCGWLKDRFGVSWQVVPTQLDRMLASEDPAQAARVTEAFLEMKKLDLERLRAAWRG